MNNTEMITVVGNLTNAFKEAGGTITKGEKIVFFKYKSLMMVLEEPYFQLSCMGEQVFGIKGWPYNSVTINGKTYYFKHNAVVPQEMIDYIALCIDKLGKNMVTFSRGNNLIEQQLFEANRKHKQNPTRETYRTLRILKNLFIEEYSYNSMQRKSRNKDNARKFKNFVAVKNQLPHSLKYIKNQEITLKKTVMGFVATTNASVFSRKSHESNAYLAIQKAKKQLQEQMTKQKVMTVKVLTVYPF
mgnify:CR=1 FL=1